MATGMAAFRFFRGRFCPLDRDREAPEDRASSLELSDSESVSSVGGEGNVRDITDRESLII